MNGKIDKHGALCIERKGALSDQYCPFTKKQNRYCDDTCPFFGEPKEEGGKTLLKLCKGIIEFDTFNDDRNMPV